MVVRSGLDQAASISISCGTEPSTKKTAVIRDFFTSFVPPRGLNSTVSTWWNTIISYKDKSGNAVSGTVKLTKQLGDVKYSLWKHIKRARIGNYVKSKIDMGKLSYDHRGIYLVLTSKDATVDQFCMDSCGFHGGIMTLAKRKVVYAYVGDPSVQRPGLCAWPYTIPAYGPVGQALVAPNGIGSDGIIINVATVLAGAATNPFKATPWHHWRVVTACQGIFGDGAYPGYPGDLKVDKMSKASYNA